MIRNLVRSSDLYSVGYDEASNILEIEFDSGSIYQYFNVPLFIYNALLTASSLGKYFASNIKFSYKYTRII